MRAIFCFILMLFMNPALAWASADIGGKSWSEPTELRGEGKIIRRHGFTADPEKAPTTIHLAPKTASETVPVDNSEGQDTAYPTHIQDPKAVEILKKFGPPPRKYDADAVQPSDNVTLEGQIPLKAQNTPAMGEGHYGYQPKQMTDETLMDNKPDEDLAISPGRKARKTTTISLPPKGKDDAAQRRRGARSSPANRKGEIADLPPDSGAVERQTPQANFEEKMNTKPDKAQKRGRGRRAKSDESGSPELKPEPSPAVNADQVPARKNTADDMDRAYKAFDFVYENSLGKSRKELTELWGFPMQKMGATETEIAYGFRQRGILAEIPSLKIKKRTSHYTSGTATPKQSGKDFACLVILWVDKAGRGVVIDGDAVGDCFIVESLPEKPLHFER